MKLRDYQQRAIDQLYDWFLEHDTGNPCLVLPTGAGKSLIIASLIHNALQQWPETRVLMLTHVKELIEQNAEKMRSVWPNAPMGIYSASLGQKVLYESITFAGIQSIHKKARLLGHVDLIFIDECHMVSHAQQGQYRAFIKDLQAINPHIRVVGLTATPYRLGHGMIHEGEGVLFDDLIEPVTIEELVAAGYLAPLSSKHTSTEIDVSSVGKRGGEFIAGQLEQAVDNDDTTARIVTETLQRASDCRSLLFFCTGVSHAEHMADELNRRGVSADVITGATPPGKRKNLIEQFRAGTLRALTNCDVLTTGFDAPNIDCLVMARPTMSPGLYVQMAGRGMRLKQHASKCLVLDFAGNVAMHGPITAVAPPSQVKKGTGEAPTKTCPQCAEIVSAGTMKCPTCGYQWEKEEKEKLAYLRDDDIMGIKPTEMTVSGWQWRKHISRASGNEMLLVRYYGGLTSHVDEYFNVLSDSQMGERHRRIVTSMMTRRWSLISHMEDGNLDFVAEELNKCAPPSRIFYRREGKFFKVEKREYQ